MPAPSSTPSNTTDTPVPTTPAAEPETLDVVWIGEAQSVEQKLLGIAPHVRVSGRDTVSVVEALQSGAACADVVVIDTTTPGVETQDILLRMKAAGTDLPIVLLTTTGSGRLISDTGHLATCDVVVKMQGFEHQLPAAFRQVRARHDLTAMFRESRLSQDRLRTVLEFQPAVMCVVGPDGVISALNQAGLSLLGADQEHVVGRSLTSFLPPEERDELLDLARRACAGEPCTLDHVVLKADASRVNVRTRAVPFETGHGGVALVTIHERSGPTAEELASLAGQCDALSVALGEAKGQLDEVRAERARESARADALSSELAEALAALNDSMAALKVERERSSDLLVELATTKSMLEQSSRLQAVLEADHKSMQEVREQLRRFTANTDSLFAGIMERQQGTLAQLEDVADPTI